MSLAEGTKPGDDEMGVSTRMAGRGFSPRQRTRWTRGARLPQATRAESAEGEMFTLRGRRLDGGFASPYANL